MTQSCKNSLNHNSWIIISEPVPTVSHGHANGAQIHETPAERYSLRANVFHRKAKSH